ncbi:MAG: hypothetical protein OQL28_12775 [Sedimenticola sp.]|nr:hypothetical protein [Sedimenticola sp.]
MGPPTGAVPGLNFPMPRTSFIWFLFLVPLLLSCSSDTLAPDEKIRQLLAEGELAVESRSVSAVAPFVSEGYRDDRGQDRRSVLRLLAGYFLGHQSIHLLTQVTGVTLTGDEEAEATVFVAVAGQPIESTSQLLSLRADLIRLSIRLSSESGDWQVVSAQWRRAEPADFLN